MRPMAKTVVSKVCGATGTVLIRRFSTPLLSRMIVFIGNRATIYSVPGGKTIVQESIQQDLSKLRASLVKDASLGKLAMDLGFGEHLNLGGGERKSGGHRRESILADALEALFGAVYLDSGIDAAATVIRNVFADRLSNLPSIEDLRDPKTRLQEWLQGRGEGLPVYELVKVSGKAHRQRFDISCSIQNGEQLSTGSGTTRRNAEQEAARAMLVIIGEETADV